MSVSPQQLDPFSQRVFNSIDSNIVKTLNLVQILAIQKSTNQEFTQ